MNVGCFASPERASNNALAAEIEFAGDKPVIGLGAASGRSLALRFHTMLIELL